MESKAIGWGKCNILVKDLDVASSKWTKLPTPKENTTKLTPTKGDKKEAPIEGGENEAVKYSANKYAVVYYVACKVARSLSRMSTALLHITSLSSSSQRI